MNLPAAIVTSRARLIKPAWVGSTSAWHWVVAGYLTAMTLAITAYFVSSGVLSALAYVSTAGLALIALVLAAPLHHPRNAWPWGVLAAGQAAFMLGDLSWFADDLNGTGSFPSIADAFYLVGYPIFGVGLGLFILSRRPRYSVARLVDATAIGVAALFMLLLAYLPAIGGDASLDATGKLTLLAYPAGDVILLAAAAYLLFGGSSWRGRAQQSLLAGLVLLMAADVLYGLFLSDTEYAQSFLDAMWMLSYGAVGLAALLPSMRDLTEEQDKAGEVGVTRATMALLAVVAILTASDILGELNAGGNNVLLEIAQVALLGLLFVRAYEATTRQARQERRTGALIAHASDAMAVVGSDGVVQLSNPAAERLLGVPAAQSVGRPIVDFMNLVHPDDRAVNEGRLLAVIATPGAHDEAELRALTANGDFRWLKIAAVNRESDPAVKATVITFHDVTEQRVSQAELRRLGTAIEQASDAVIVTDIDVNIEYVNPAFEQITGYSREEVMGRNPRFLKSDEQTPRFYESMWMTLSRGRPWRADFVNRRKDGDLYRMVGVITPLHDDDGRITGYVGVQRDVTRQRALEDTARQLSRERSLIAETIRGIDAHAEPEAIAQTVCSQLTAVTDVALAAIFIFDQRGSAIPYGFALASGDRVDRRELPQPRVSYLVQQAGRGPWIEAWKDGSDHPYSELLARQGVRAHAYAPVRDGNRLIGLLIVGSAAPKAEEQLAEMLAAIVECANICGTLIGVKVAERSETSAQREQIAGVIEKAEFWPVYQALVDIKTDRIVGYEALTRFADGTAPDIRFAEAHAVGLGARLELAAIRTAIDGAEELPPDLWLNINASPDLILDGDVLQQVLERSARELVLEVTEHSEITDYVAFRRAVNKLGPRVRLAVDDAGAGFASLRHIVELRPSFVKLDRQVIAGVDHDEARQAMIAGLKHFAQTTGCWLIAEGVETQEEMDRLRSLEVRYVQGYLLGRPIPAQDLGDEESRWLAPVLTVESV